MSLPYIRHAVGISNIPNPYSLLIFYFVLNFIKIILTIIWMLNSFVLFFGCRSTTAMHKHVWKKFLI